MGVLRKNKVVDGVKSILLEQTGSVILNLEFMDNAFVKPTLTPVELTVPLGQGGNIYQHYGDIATLEIVFPEIEMAQIRAINNADYAQLRTYYGGLNKGRTLTMSGSLDKCVASVEDGKTKVIVEKTSTATGSDDLGNFVWVNPVEDADVA